MGLEKFEIQEGHIEVQNLSFCYDQDKDVLKNINLQINLGEKIGVVGQSGIGKSTLANLFLRFYEPEAGEILIDGTPLNEFQYSSVRQAIGIVNQENTIFNLSVRDNIIFGQRASDEELWEILDKVSLKDVVEKLPNGLDTVLEGQNMSMSGGENQRLCIARLIFRNPPIIILDEATSALDFKSEKAVQAALDALSENRTMIIISHRYQALVHTDKILMLHGGEQVGFAPCNVLVAENKYFADLFAEQKELAG